MNEIREQLKDNESNLTVKKLKRKWIHGASDKEE